MPSLFTQPPLFLPPPPLHQKIDPRRSAPHVASSGPSTSVYRPARPSLISFELPGAFHRANDVQTDSWSIDNKSQSEHQAYDANPRAAPTASGYSQDPVLSRPQVPTFERPHPDSVQGGFDLSQTGHNQSCRCWRCVIGDVTLAPLRGQNEEYRAHWVPFSPVGCLHRIINWFILRLSRPHIPDPTLECSSISGNIFYPPFILTRLQSDIFFSTCASETSSLSLSA